MTKAGLPTRISTPRFAFPKNQWHNETKLLRYGDEFARDFHPTSLFTESAKHPRHRQSSHFGYILSLSQGLVKKKKEIA
jgi:hypothetical protein